MNGNYYLDRLYAQEIINDRLREAEIHRLTRKNKKEKSFGLAIAAAASWIGRAASQAAHSLEALGNARVAPLHR
ncbi:MAG: hypothetical protein PVH65_17345 [Chloroflexota bacterium]|jgi:hypothetical protein